MKLPSDNYHGGEYYGDAVVMYWGFSQQKYAYEHKNRGSADEQFCYE